MYDHHTKKPVTATENLAIYAVHLLRYTPTPVTAAELQKKAAGRHFNRLANYFGEMPPETTFYQMQQILDGLKSRSNRKAERNLNIKRIYEPVDPHDGVRVLVDRLWPRGISKAEAALDHWLKEIAPSSELRTWFGHRSERFTEFKIRYRAELDTNEAVHNLLDIIRSHDHTTLLYAAHDPNYNHAKVLAQYLEEQLSV